MGGVALLLEEAFREDLGFLHFWSRFPLLRDVGARLWAASMTPALPDSLLGFVWEEDGRIVGNATMTPDEYRRRTWLISNVAVYPNFRRRGIARELMQACLEEAARRSATWVILNVRPNNDGAIRLYEQLGFERVDTEMGYVRRRKPGLNSSLPEMRRLSGDEHRAAFELAREGMSERLKLFRPPRPAEFAINIEDRMAERVTDLFTGQRTERWGLFQQGAFVAAVTVHAQRIGTPHSFDIRVAPGERGPLEEGLVRFARHRLDGLPTRDIVTRVLTSHTELAGALAADDYVPTRGLMLMAKSISE